MKCKVLFVDNDLELIEVLKPTLERDGILTKGVESAEKALERLWDWKPDLLTVDLALPGISGLEFCRIVRNDPRVRTLPIIAVTSHSERTDVLAAYEQGVDDFLLKPFDPRELLARIRAVLRRYYAQDHRPEVYEYDGLRVNVLQHTAHLNGTPLSLTAKEFGLLHLLLKRKGYVLSRDYLLEYIWGYDAEVSTRTVDMHISRLRHKLGSPSMRLIETVEGVGYRLGGETPTPVSEVSPEPSSS
ncbi:MAG: response regulator transcription factor [Elusimicrobia bacterium]|nr:response regulator transcription factor [Elusimicrobiota bacterium]